MVNVVFVTIANGWVESVWTTALGAVEAREKMSGKPDVSAAYTAVRPLDSDEPTEESKRALQELRDLERERHNARARKLRGEDA